MDSGGDRGSSTAELAVLLPVIAVFLCLVLGLGVLGMQQIQVQQAAAAVARELARGQTPDQARQTGVRLAGTEAGYTLSTSGQLARVQVTRRVELPLLGPITLRGEASALREQP